MQAVINVEADGQVSENEWDAAGYYEIRGGEQAGDILSALYYGYDPDNFYLRVDANKAWAELGEGVLGIYLGSTGVSPTTGYARLGGTDSLLGFGATALIELQLNADEPTRVTLSTPNPSGRWPAPFRSELIMLGQGDDILEIGIPFDELGEPLAGDQVYLRVIWSEGSITVGGGPDDTNHTRIIDLVFDGDQAEGLGTYPASQESVGKLGPADFAQVPLLLVD